MTYRLLSHDPEKGWTMSNTPFLDAWIEKTAFFGFGTEPPSVEKIKELSPEKREKMLRTVLQNIRPAVIKRVLRERMPTLDRAPMKVGKGSGLPMRKEQVRQIPMKKRRGLLENMLSAMNRDSVRRVVMEQEESSGKPLMLTGFFSQPKKKG